MPADRPGGGKRICARAELADAACKLIAEKGCEGLTVAAVARRAGLPTGTIHDSFKSRMELFMAVAEVNAAPIFPRVWPGTTFRELMRAIAEAVIEAAPQRRASMVGTLGFHIEALTHEELRQRVVAETRQHYRRSAAALLELIPADERPPAKVFMPVVHALADGLILHRAITPELVPDEAIHAAFYALGAQA